MINVNRIYQNNKIYQITKLINNFKYIMNILILKTNKMRIE